MGHWFWSGETFKMLYFLSKYLIFGIGLGLPLPGCAGNKCLIEGMAVAGETMLRGAGRRATLSRTATAAAPAGRPAQPLLLASAKTHHCDCGCHRHRPDLDNTTTTTGKGIRPTSCNCILIPEPGISACITKRCQIRPFQAQKKSSDGISKCVHGILN